MSLLCCGSCQAQADRFVAKGHFSQLALRHGVVDAESELIQLRALLRQPHEAQQQLELQRHAERLAELRPLQLALLLEEGFLCGMLDVAQLQLLHALLLPLQQPLVAFYRRLTAELPHFRYDLSLPRHVAMLQRYLRLHEACPKAQARRLLSAGMSHMSTLPQPQLERFLDALNPAQLHQLTAYLGCSYVALPPRQLQRLHRTALRVQRGKPQLQLTRCHVALLGQLLSGPVDEPLSLPQRSYLQSLLDHLLPLPKLQQLLFLRRLQLGGSRMRHLRLVLHHPALLADPLRLRQLYDNLDQLSQTQ